MVPTEQMLHWIEQCEQAAKEHDLAKLTKLISGINAAVDNRIDVPETSRAWSSNVLQE